MRARQSDVYAFGVPVFLDDAFLDLQSTPKRWALGSLFEDTSQYFGYLGGSGTRSLKELGALRNSEP